VTWAFARLMMLSKQRGRRSFFMMFLAGALD